MLKEKRFWEWFEINQSEYQHLDDLDIQQKELLLDQLLTQLHEFCDGLYFQIGGNPSKERRELIITAEGNLKYFQEVEKLVNAAPEFNSWQIIAFKQPMGNDFITTYSGLVLDPKNMWFLPLNNKQKPEMIGIKICVNNYASSEANKYKQAIYQVVDNLLGEKITATEIDYLDVGNLLDYNPEKDGLIELIDLPKYIIWKKGKVSDNTSK